MIRVLYPIFLLLLTLPFFSACDTGSKKEAAIIAEEETIAVVNNKKIPLSKFQSRYQEFLIQYAKIPEKKDKYTKRIKEVVINEMIEEELMTQEAARKGVKVTEEELEIEAGASYGNSRFERYLKEAQISSEEWKERLKKHLIHRKLIQKEVVDKIPVTKRERAQYYNEHRKEFLKPSQRKVRHIAVATYDDALLIREKIPKRKTSSKRMTALFTQLVKDYSISPDKINDGDLGYISKGMMPEDLENAIFKLRRINNVSNIVQHQDGYHIFLLEKINPKKKLTRQEAKDTIKRILIRQKQDQAFVNWMAKLKSTASISIDRAMLTADEGF